MIIERRGLARQDFGDLHQRDLSIVQQRFLSAKEVAVYLGLSIGAIRKWIRTGQIPFSRMNGSIRFDVERINVWAQKNNAR
ncbi:MAG: helix-turn-helix domain-containing protein [Candidatus Zapsychrus exili]|nr:helix-turn-helix domain-containing protein [Candidatus Zapsychrus exili]